MTIPTVTPYTGEIANPDGSQTQTEFTQNMFDQLSFEKTFVPELNNSIAEINSTITQVNYDANSAAQSARDAQASANSAATVQFVRSRIGNISDYVGVTLTESERFNIYQYPDDSNYWYGVKDNEAFPIIIPSDPTNNDKWILVNAASDQWVAETVRNVNLLSNHNFLTPSPDAITRPSVTPTDYAAGTQIFSGVFVESDIEGLTYINGRVKWDNDAGKIYFVLPNTSGLEYVTEFTASVADIGGTQRTRGVSFALVGDEYRVTVGIDALSDGVDETLLGSVKFEQGKVATGHAVQSSKGQVYTFNNVAEMIDNGAPFGAKVQWLGYYAASDGGSNWGVVKNGVHTEDGGSIFSINSNTYIEANLSSKVSIKKFGIGLAGSPSPVSDQTLLVQNCINKSSSVKFNSNCSVNELDIAPCNEIVFSAGVIVEYHPTASGNFMFDMDSLTGKYISGKGTVKNVAARRDGSSEVVDTFNGTGIVHTINCDNIHTTDFTVDEGSHAIFFEDTTNSSMRKHVAKNTNGWMYITANANSVIIRGNTADGSFTDGFKFRGQSEFLTVTGNIAQNNIGDGFDLFDGFFKSILSNNQAKNNGAFGYECKGTPGSDYNFRDSTVTGNIASGNTLQGFSIVSVRGSTFGNNESVENDGAGYVLENVQECAFNGDIASKNKFYGWQLGNSSSVSRNTFSACVGVNNSKDNDNIYSNWYLNSTASGNELSACRGFKGVGGDSTNPKYGIEFEVGSNGNKIVGGTYEPNTTGGFGGDVSAQLITMATGPSAVQRTENFTLGEFTSAAVTPNGYITVRDNTGASFRVAVQTV